MLEVHPFGDFIPPNAKYLLLGSFTTKPASNYQWFYANGRNHFWPIMEEVYGIPLDTKERQQSLFSNLNMALADIIYSCERERGSNLDNNLINITYNTKGVENIFQTSKVQRIFFTSRFVETTFGRLFSHLIDGNSKLEQVYLPSPSPRYAAMSRTEKIQRYKELLPKLSLTG